MPETWGSGRSQPSRALLPRLLNCGLQALDGPTGMND